MPIKGIFYIQQHGYKRQPSTQKQAKNKESSMAWMQYTVFLEMDDNIYRKHTKG